MMDGPSARRRAASFRRIGWLAVAGMAALALVGPGAGPVGAQTSGAIWTSLADGQTVNANRYDAKQDVYLNGGPQNCGQSGGLTDGDYYFQVTDPSGKVLLSTDAIKLRQLQVVNGVIAGVSGAGSHAEGDATCSGGQSVQLYPFDDTPNNGGEYSVDIAPVGEVEACAGFDADAPFNFKGCANTKNDNFKVLEEEEPPPPDQTADLVVYKWFDLDGDPATVDDIVPGPGWEFQVEVKGGTATPAGGTTVLDDRGTATTDDDVAFVAFEISLGDDTASVDVKEKLQKDFAFVDAFCVDQETEDERGTPGKEKVAEVEINAGETVVCDFFNTSGEEAGATATPRTTAPPTDALPITGTPGGAGWSIALLAIAGLLATLTLVPGPATVRRRR